MSRWLWFVALVVLFLAWTFPHELVVRKLLLSRFDGSGIQASVESVRPALWPPGYRLKRVVLARDGTRAEIDSVTIGVTWRGGLSFDANACRGTLRGSVSRSHATTGESLRTLEARFHDVDPSTCIALGGPALTGRFDGSITLVGLGRSKQRWQVAREGVFSVDGRDGAVSGYLPVTTPTRPSGKRSEPIPIGEWGFSRVSLEAVLDSQRLVVTKADAEAEGIAWKTGEAIIDLSKGIPRVNVEFRARRTEDSARSKAVLGLLPRATERDGWRNYKITGSGSALRLAGLK